MSDNHQDLIKKHFPGGVDALDLLLSNDDGADGWRAQVTLRTLPRGSKYRNRILQASAGTRGQGGNYKTPDAALRALRDEVRLLLSDLTHLLGDVAVKP